jgi:hypothetical protein
MYISLKKLTMNVHTLTERADEAGLYQCYVLVGAAVSVHSCEFPVMTLGEHYDSRKCCNNGGFIIPELCRKMSTVRDIFKTWDVSWV